MLRQPVYLLAGLLGLAACATPQERCVAVATKDLRVVQSLIAQSERDLERGYALRTETRVTPSVGFCTGNNGARACLGSRLGETQRPVALDLSTERRKLRELRAKEAELAAQAASETRLCRQRYAG
ncbi:hypothetical protein [Brevirhabdus sp.]|uniref:hypothetical protein n=1 Tax=Brevirhabdus sp. TaxID=2004514 RepID=UPI004059E13B